MTSRLPPLLIAISAATLLSCSASPTHDWNVLLITVDTLRADRLSCYGYERPTSPTLDALADAGVLFEQAIAQRSQTWPSLTSVMTSLYPHQHGVRKNGQQLETSVPTLAGVLREHGYRTAAVLTNMRRAEHPGFEEVLRFKGDERDIEATRAALEQLRDSGESKFFFWLHYIAPHKPYRPPSPFDERFGEPYFGDIDGETATLDQITLDKVDLADEDLARVQDLYDGEIAFVDDQIRQVLEALETHGLAENTLVFVTADHGEELFQRNHYFYHSNSIYDSVLHVPWIVRLPGAEGAGRRIARVVELIDLAPTLLDLLSLPVPETFRGRSHANLVLGGDHTAGDNPAAFSELPWGVLSIRTARWRYVSNPAGAYSRERPYGLVDDARRDGYTIGRRELYERRADPLELVDLLSADAGGDAAEELENRLAVWQSSWYPETETTEIDAETRRELQELGYIQ